LKVNNDASNDVGIMLVQMMMQATSDDGVHDKTFH
jgi:hypothetical protein